MFTQRTQENAVGVRQLAGTLHSNLMHRREHVVEILSDFHKHTPCSMRRNLGRKRASVAQLLDTYTLHAQYVR